MTPADRALLERRYGLELRNGRILVGAHLLMLSLMLILWSFGGKDRGAWVFLSCILGLSGAGWLIWMSVLFRRLRADLREGQVGVSLVTLVKKYTKTGKATVYRHLVLDPPEPKKDVHVSQAVFESFAEGDALRIRYFPASAVLALVERMK